MKYFFLIETTRLAESVENLNSFLTKLAGKLWRCKLGKNVLAVVLKGLKSEHVRFLLQR